MLLTVVPASAATESAVAVYLQLGHLHHVYVRCFDADDRRHCGHVLLLTITFFLLAIADAGSDKSILHIGGWFGLATAIAAWYASFAGVLNATWGRVVLPVMPLSRPTVR